MLLRTIFNVSHRRYMAEILPILYLMNQSFSVPEEQRLPRTRLYCLFFKFSCTQVLERRKRDEIYSYVALKTVQFLYGQVLRYQKASQRSVLNSRIKINYSVDLKVCLSNKVLSFFCCGLIPCELFVDSYLMNIVYIFKSFHDVYY